MKTSSAMPMLAGKSVTYYHETASKDKKALWPVSQVKTVKVDKKGNLKVAMQPKGGLIVKRHKGKKKLGRFTGLRAKILPFE